jgi:hypothetical protein
MTKSGVCTARKPDLGPSLRRRHTAMILGGKLLGFRMVMQI